jgi:hypothetical protein
MLDPPPGGDGTLPTGGTYPWREATRMTTGTGASRGPELLEVPERLLLMADGRGDPNGSPEFQRTAEALFSVS